MHNSYNREDSRTAIPQLEKKIGKIKDDLLAKYEELDQKLKTALKTANAIIKDLDARGNHTTTETRIGTWVDGKPLYRKVYVFDGSWAANTSGSFSVADLNIDTCVTLRGNMSSDSYKHIGFDFYNSSFDYIYMSSSSVVYWKIGWASTKNIVIVEYTKTTD